MILNVDTLSAVFVLYFAIIFVIGWYGLRTTGSRSDYWIAGGNLNWLLGGATLSATHASAGTFIGTIGIIYDVGWSFGWVVLSIPAAYWFVAAFIAPRLTNVTELTLPSFIEKRYYSKSARAVAAFIILIVTTIYIQAQIIAGGIIGEIVFGIERTNGMVLFTTTLIAYTITGGMIAVVYTDLLQLFIMAVGVIVSLPLALRNVGGLENLMSSLDKIDPTIVSWEGLPTTLIMTMAMAFFLGSIASPEKVIRLYAMKDMKTIRRGVLFSMFIVTLINLLVFVIGICSIALFPNLTTGDIAMPAIARTVLPPFTGALILAAITSAMMSTVDSLLIVAGSALSEDILESLIDTDYGEKTRLLISRIGIIFVGVSPLILILLGVGEGTLIQIIILLFTSLMASCFFAPVMLGLWWKKSTKQGAITSMLIGLCVTFGWQVFGYPDVFDSVAPGVLASFVSMVGVSLLTPKPPETAIKPYFPN